MCVLLSTTHMCAGHTPGGLAGGVLLEKRCTTYVLESKRCALSHVAASSVSACDAVLWWVGVFVLPLDDDGMGDVLRLTFVTTPPGTI